MIDTMLNDTEIANAVLFIECHYKELENGISKPEHMKCEQLRFNSFKHRTFDTYKGVWPSQLAKAGFYFDPRTSETVCYWCRIRIPASRWKKGTNPFIVHRAQNPDCEYITSQCKENIPFHTQSQRANRLSYLEPNRSSTRWTSPGSVESDHPNEVANSALASLPYRSTNQSGGLSSRGSNRNRQREMFDSDGPYPLQRMKTEEARVMTYTMWPNDAAVSPEELALAGFFYTGSTDRVQCAFCENVLRNWESGDNPTFEHRRHFPRCRFVLGQDVGNVPIPTAQRQQVMANLMTRSPTMQPAANRQQPQTVGQQTLPSQQPQRPPVDVNALSVMGVNTDLPKHPRYAIETTRLQTYRTWRADQAQPAHTLCQAGFFYTGQDDNVRCFFCDGGLRNWESEDDPFSEHARWFPRCAFIRGVRGEDFVNSLTTRVQHMPNVPAQEPAATTTRGTSSGNTHTPGVQYRVEEHEVKAHMDTPAVRVVLDMGFDRSIVLNVVRKQLRQRSDDFFSAEMLLAALFEEEDAQMQEEELESVEEPTTTPPAPRKDTEQARKRRKKEKKGKQGETSTPPPELAPEDSGVISSGKDGKLNNTETKTLLEENRKLKDQMMCKVCMDAEANIVFLPCGHLTCCANCAPALRNCAMCRSLIRGTVRTYLS